MGQSYLQLLQGEAASLSMEPQQYSHTVDLVFVFCNRIHIVFEHHTYGWQLSQMQKAEI